MFYDSTWQERAAQVTKALGLLVEEHGAPNRFHGTDVVPLTSINLAAVRRVGRYGGEFVVRSRVVKYERGWFVVGDNPLEAPDAAR